MTELTSVAGRMVMFSRGGYTEKMVEGGRV